MILKYGVITIKIDFIQSKQIILIINNNIIDRKLLLLIRMFHTTYLFHHNYILKFDDLLISRNIFLYNLIHDNFNIDFKSYIFDKDNNKFILPLMRTNQFQTTIFCRVQKLYNNIMFGNI